jgi:hypothetical protein
MNLWAKFPLFKERKKYIAEQEQLELKLLEKTKQLANLGYEIITAETEKELESKVTRASNSHRSLATDSDLTDGEREGLALLRRESMRDGEGGEVRIDFEPGVSYPEHTVTPEQFHIFMRLACAYHGK